MYVCMLAVLSFKVSFLSHSAFSLIKLFIRTSIKCKSKGSLSKTTVILSSGSCLHENFSEFHFCLPNAMTSCSVL